MSIEIDRFKALLRRWASGVAILTSGEGERACGMTVSSFTSVSAEPPLVLVCTARASQTRARILETRRFALSFLGQEQAAISAHFASRGAEGARFEGIATEPCELGMPRIDGALAHLECELRSAHEEGTHTLLVGEIVHGEVGAEAPPLLYFDGAYRELR